MRHRKSFNHLGRKSAHRNAMLSNMAASLILHKRIETTTAKAKALRSYVEPLITKSKEDTTHSRRVVFSYLQNKEAVTELFREVASKVHDRPGGYTRLLKLGARLGDNAEMCIIELVDFNENMLAETSAKPKASRRRRGSKKKDQEKVAAVSVPDTSEKEQENVVEEEITDAGLVAETGDIKDDITVDENEITDVSDVPEIQEEESNKNVAESDTNPETTEKKDEE